MNATQNQNSKALVPKLIWFALFMSNCLLLYVSHFLKPVSGGEESVPSPELLPLEVFYILAATAIVLSQILPRIIAKNAAPKDELTERGANGEPAEMSDRMFGALFAPLIIELALLESVSILGFVLGYVQGRLDLHRGFFIVAIFFVIRAFPTSPEKLRLKYLGR